MRRGNVRKYVRRVCKKLGIPPPRVHFLKRIPRSTVRDLRAMRKLEQAKKYGGAYYDAGKKTIYILPRTKVTRSLIAHEIAHHYQNVKHGLKSTRVRSKTRRKLERRADAIARKILRMR